MGSSEAFHSTLRNLSRLSAALVFAWVLLAKQVSAAPASAAEGEAFQAAQAAAAEGRRLLKERRIVEAISAYERAEALFPEPKNLFLIASLYQKLPEQCAKELSYWDRFMRACQHCRYRGKGEERNQEVRRRCLVRLVVSSEPAGANVTLNGERKGQTPYQELLTVGTYQLQLERDGYQRRLIPLRLQRGEGSRRIQSALDPVVSAPPPPPQDRRVLAWSLIGVGLSGGLLGMYQLSLAQEEIDAARSATQSVDYEAAKERFESAQMWTWLSLGVGVGSGLAGVWLMLDPPEEAGVARLTIGPQSLALQGRF